MIEKYSGISYFYKLLNLLYLLNAYYKSGNYSILVSLYYRIWLNFQNL